MRFASLFFVRKLTDRSSVNPGQTLFPTCSAICFARHFFADFLDRTVI